MKTKLFIISIIAFLSSINLSAQDVVTYSNIDKTDSECKKEYITYAKDSSAPIKKMVYIENQDGQLVSKEVYKWENGAWEGINKMEYKYNVDSKPSIFIYTKWNKKNQTWSDKSEFLSYRYNSNGELLATIQTTISNINDLTIAE